MKKTYLQVIQDTLDDALSTDKRVFLIGEDIGLYGGCFGTSKYLFEKHGKDCVIDSPMSEQAVVGLAIGAALKGLRPIVEIMFMDFLSLTYDQLLNHASIFNYLTDSSVNVPLVIRVPAGAGRGYGATHSKMVISPFMHIPGLKIVTPSRVSNVAGLLKAAIKDPNPVIFVEHKSLYGLTEDYEPKEVDIGQAEVLREGNDITLISFSKSIQDCLQAANELANRGIQAEVIDLQTIKPLDMNTITNSVNKTKKALIVEEGFEEAGVAAELSSRIMDSCFYSLEAPIKRLCSLNAPIPCAAHLERITLPTIEKIVQSAQQLSGL